MGYQQLLLLVLATIIAGLAVAAGASAFEAKRNKAEMEFDQLALMDMAAKAQTWKMKPRVLGGGDNTARQNFDAITVADLGVQAAGHIYSGLEGGGEQSVSNDDIVQTQDGTCYHVDKSETGLRIASLETACEKSSWSRAVLVNGTYASDIRWIFREDITMAGGTLGLGHTGTLGNVDSLSTGHHIGALDDEEGGSLPESCDPDLLVRDQSLECLQALLDESA